MLVRVRWGRPKDELAHIAVLAGLSISLLCAYLLIPFFIRGFRFPVGPDASVYLWWIGLVRHEGLSVVGTRAGVPAVALVLSEAFGISPVTTLAGFQCTVATAIGMAVSALLTGHGRRAQLLAAFCSGLFAVHVAAGYFSTLAFVAIFLGTAACLGVGSARSTLLAAAMLVAGGITHPQVATLGGGVLAVAALLALRSGQRREAVNVGGALCGGLAGAAVAALALLRGPSPLEVDTSRDLFLIRAGLSDLLRRLYAHRIVLHLWSYAPYALVPLAAAGTSRVTGFPRRLLLAWGGVSLAVISVGALTGWYPPERALAFAFVLPILAGFGLERLFAHRAKLATVAGVVGLAAIIGSAGWTWWRTAPPTYEVEAARATEAARYAAATPPGTPIVFQVAGTQPVLTFFATRAANEFRAAVPPERIRDVYVVVPPAPTSADAERRALSSIYDADVDAAAARSGRDPLVFRLTAFIRGAFPEPAGGLPPEIGPGVRVIGEQPAPREDTPVRLAPSSPIAIAATGFGTLAFLTLAGWGWARTIGPDGGSTLALAPVVALAMLTLSAVILERVGLAIDTASGAWAVLALAAIPGWIAARAHASDARPPRIEAPA